MRFLAALCCAWKNWFQDESTLRRSACAIVVLLGMCVGAEARQSPYPPVTQFSGDRYGAQAHLGPEVVRAIGCPPPACVRKAAKVRYLYPTRKRPPVVRQRWKHVPTPAPRPIASGDYRAEAPLSVLEGVKREAGRAVGRPAAWCGWWLGQHLGMLDRRLWLARNWATVGTRSPGPAPGVIVVWRHHVGIITGRTAKGWIVKSGNDGHRVRERPRSIVGAIAFRSSS